MKTSSRWSEIAIENAILPIAQTRTGSSILPAPRPTTAQPAPYPFINRSRIASRAPYTVLVVFSPATGHRLRMRRSAHPLYLLMDPSGLPSMSPADSRLTVVKTAARLHNHNTPCSPKARMVLCLPTAPTVLMALSARLTAQLLCLDRLSKQMERMVLLSLCLSAVAWAQEVPWGLPLAL